MYLRDRDIRVLPGKLSKHARRPRAGYYSPVAVRIPGEDDRPTVDLGPRGAPTYAGDDHGDDLGADDDGLTEAEPIEADQDGALGQPRGSAAIATRTLEPDPQIHQLPTQLQQRKTTSTDSQTKYSTSTASPVEAMRLEEIARARVFLLVVVVTSIAGLAAALATSGDRIAKLVQLGGCMLTLAGSLWMLRAVDPQRYSAKELLGPALVISLGAFA